MRMVARCWVEWNKIAVITATRVSDWSNNLLGGQSEKKTNALSIKQTNLSPLTLSNQQKCVIWCCRTHVPAVVFQPPEYRTQITYKSARVNHLTRCVCFNQAVEETTKSYHQKGLWAQGAFPTSKVVICYMKKGAQITGYAAPQGGERAWRVKKVHLIWCQMWHLFSKEVLFPAVQLPRAERCASDTSPLISRGV